MTTSGPSNIADDKTAPSAPSSLSATAVSGTEIDLGWNDNSSDEDLFLIERSPNGSSSWVQIDTVPANITSYDNTGLSNSTQYFYRVKARRNPSADSSYSNTANATTASNNCAVATNLLFQYDFSQLGLTDGTLISAVSDLSPNGWNLSQSSPTNQWTAKTNIQNGLSVARVTAADQFMDITGLSLARLNRTFHFVLNYTPGQVGDGYLVNSLSGDGGFEILADTDPGSTVTAFSGGTTFDPGFAAASGWQVLSFSVNDSTHKTRIFRNGSFIGQINYNHVVSTDTLWTIGVFDFLSQTLLCDLGEITCNTDAHSDIQIASTANCLRTKWGI